MRNVGGSSRSACTAPSTSTRGALSPPIASSAMLITSVFDRHPLLAAVVAAGRAHVVRPLQITAARARLERDVRRLVVGAAGAVLSFCGASLWDGPGVVLLSVAGRCLLSGAGPPAGVARPPRPPRGPASDSDDTPPRPAPSGKPASRIVHLPPRAIVR